MARQLKLFALPARPIVKRMHVVDAGLLPGGQKGIQFVCRRCGHDTDWILDRWTITENKRGHPCPVCNASADHSSPNTPSGSPGELIEGVSP